MKEFLQKLILKLASEISQVVSKIHMPFSRKLLIEEDEIRLEKVLRKGDIISTTTRGELSNPFIPGFWGHVGIYIGDGMVVEAVTHGVKITKLSWFLRGKDYVAVSRANFLSEEQKQKVVDYCVMQVGKPYDFSFNTSDIKAFYCSELIYSGIMYATNNESPFVLNIVLGQETISPSDFYNATNKFDRMFKSKAYLES